MNDVLLSASDQKAIIEQVAGQLHDRYRYPQVGRTLSQHLRRSFDQGKYATLNQPDAFDQAVMNTLNLPGRCRNSPDKPYLIYPYLS